MWASCPSGAFTLGSQGAVSVPFSGGFWGHRLAASFHCCWANSGPAQQKVGPPTKALLLGLGCLSTVCHSRGRTHTCAQIPARIFPPAVILTRKPLYIKETAFHITVNLSVPRAVLGCAVLPTEHGLQACVVLQSPWLPDKLINSV